MQGLPKMRKTIAMLTTCLMIGAMVNLKPTPARAGFIPVDYCCDEAIGFVAAAGLQLTTLTQGFIAATWIVLANGFATINTQINANTKAITEISQYQVNSAANILRQAKTKEKEVDTAKPPSYGITASATSAIGNSQLMSETIASSLGQVNTKYYRNQAKESASSSGANAIAIANTHLKYCGKLEESMSLCTAVAADKQDMDIRASTILAHDVLDTDKLQAALHFTQNIVGSPGARPANQDTRDAAGIVKIADKATLNARQSIASAVFDYLVSIRSPLQNSEVQEWIKKVYKSTYNTDSADKTATSQYEIIRAISTYRFYNPEWVDMLTQEKSDVVVNKEWVVLRSQRVYLDWQRQKLKQLTLAALATGNSIDAETTYKQKTNPAEELN